MPSYNLATEPWIPVLGADGAMALRSLGSVFRAAKSIADIQGTPVESASILRFLLAICHQVKTPTSLTEWKGIWGNLDAHMEECAEYVLNQGEVWDLLRQDHPFYQVAGQTGTENPAYILVYDAARKNNPVHADHRQIDDAHPMQIASLARGILATNAFGGSSGGGYRSGPLAMRSVALVLGANLAETLVLNLLVQKQKPAKVAWEAVGHVQAQSDPVDICQRYLWACRSVRLLNDPDGIRKIMLAPGNEMPEHERQEDPMVPFRPDSQGKKMIPLRLDPHRALWRSADVLLNWKSETKQIAALDQLRRAGTRELIAKDAELSLRVLAVAGDAQGPSTDLWRDDALRFSLRALEEGDRFATLQRSISEAETTSDITRKRIYGFAFRYLQNGAEGKPDPKDVGRLADELAPDLADYWAALAPMGERIACDDFDDSGWATAIKTASDDAFRRAVGRLAPDARRLRAEFAVSTDETKKTKGTQK